MQIVDLQKEIIEPINILPDGTMDMSCNGPWRFGGTVYNVEYTTEHTPHDVHTMVLQKEDELWYEPTYNYANVDIREVIRLVNKMDNDMYAHYRKEQEELTDDKCQ